MFEEWKQIVKSYNEALEEYKKTGLNEKSAEVRESIKFLAQHTIHEWARSAAEELDLEWSCDPQFMNYSIFICDESLFSEETPEDIDCEELRMLCIQVDSSEPDDIRLAWWTTEVPGMHEENTQLLYSYNQLVYLTRKFLLENVSSGQADQQQ